MFLSPRPFIFLRARAEILMGKVAVGIVRRKKKETKEKRKEKENIGKWRNRATISRLTFSEFK